MNATTFSDRLRKQPSTPSVTSSAAAQSAKERMAALSSRFATSFSELKSAVRERLEQPVEPQPPPPPPPSSTRRPGPLTPEQRAVRFKKMLQQRPMPIDKLKATCFAEGVPDGVGETASLRAIAWKLLLGYLPETRADWHPFLAQQRQSYKAFIEELTVDPDKMASAAAAAGTDGSDASESAPTDPLGVGTAADPLSAMEGSSANSPQPPPPGGRSAADGQSATAPDSTRDAVPAAEGAALGAASREDPLEDPLGACAAGGSVDAASTAGAIAVDLADHPLTSSEGSKWLEWHADQELRYEIKKDVDRTLPDYAFYNTSHAMGRYHHTAISRILFIYAKLNPGIRYVQGMNEVLAPIYYVFCQEIDDALAASASHATHATAVAGDGSAGTGAGAVGDGQARSSDEAAAHTGPQTASSPPRGTAWLGDGSLPSALTEALDAVEADAFFCFTNLMAEVRDHFCSKLDHTALGITAKIQVLERMIERMDPPLGALLKRLKVSPTFYGFRWITLLMTQEWELPDVLRLWDSLLADPRRFDFLLYFATATVRPRRPSPHPHPGGLDQPRQRRGAQAPAALSVAL